MLPSQEPESVWAEGGAEDRQTYKPQKKYARTQLSIQKRLEGLQA